MYEAYFDKVEDIPYLYIQKLNTALIHILILFKFGARHEPDDKLGIAHFLEHIIFKTTSKHSTEQLYYELENIGGQVNAFTAYEYTGYYITVLKDNFEKAFELLTEAIYDGLLKQEEIEIEKGNIIEELRLTHDEPSEYVSILAQKNAFPDSNLGREIIGTESTINSISRKDLIDLREKIYTSENILVVVGGDTSQKNIKTNIQKYLLNKIHSRKHIDNDTAVKLPQTAHFKPAQKISANIRQSLKQAHVVISFGAQHYHDDNFNYSAQILSTILGHGLGSILFILLREKLGLAYYVGTSLHQYNDTGVFDIYFGANTEKANVAVKETLKAINEIKNGKLTSEHLQRAQNLIFSGISMQTENVRSLTNTIATKFFLTNKIKSFEEIKRILYSIKIEDIIKVAQFIFNQDHCITYLANQKIDIRI